MIRTRAAAPRPVAAPDAPRPTARRTRAAAPALAAILAIAAAVSAPRVAYGVQQCPLPGLAALSATSRSSPIGTVSEPASAIQAERPFGTLRQQAALQQEWLEIRLERVLPRLMREHGVDMWIIPTREYNEDPVFFSIVSPTTMAARRRTIYVFHDRGPELGVERIAIGGTSQGGLYTVVRDPAAAEADAGVTRRMAEPWGPEQWRLLTPIVEARNPRTIAVNISRTHNFADGLTVGEWEPMRDALGGFTARVVRRDLLAVQ